MRWRPRAVRTVWLASLRWLLLRAPREMRWPLLHERRRTLDHVIGADRLNQHAESAVVVVPALVPPDVGADLGDLEVTRAHLQQFVRPASDFGFELVRRDDCVDPAHLQRLEGLVATAQERHFLGTLLADVHREEIRAAEHRRAADAHAGLSERRVVRGD